MVERLSTTILSAHCSYKIVENKQVLGQTEVLIGEQLKVDDAQTKL